MHVEVPLGPRPLDDTSFRHFAPLLEASQAYARLSGCRFRTGSFDGLEGRGGEVPSEVPPERASDPGPRLAAKLGASPKVAEFAQRLRTGEAGLVEELDRAFRVVMVESVRNAMVGMFKALDMFPPAPPPAMVDDEDCAYEDVTAPLPAVAQRLYNDQVRRLSDCGDDAGFAGRLYRRAMTASFIVDFASAQGIPLPQVSETQQSMLRELSDRVAEETRRRGASEADQTRAREAFLESLGAGSGAEKLRQEADKFWKRNWKTIAATTAAGVMFGVAGVVIAGIMSQPARRPRSPGVEGQDDSPGRHDET